MFIPWLWEPTTDPLEPRRSSKKQKKTSQDIISQDQKENEGEHSEVEGVQMSGTNDTVMEDESLRDFSDESGAKTYLQQFFNLEELESTQSVTVAKKKSFLEIADLVRTLRSRELQVGEKILEIKGFPHALKTFFKTRNCHQCQIQHVGWTCPGADEEEQRQGQKQSSKQKYSKAVQLHPSFCSYCLKTWYNGMKIEDCMETKCPKCMDICNCRSCLRTIKKDEIEFDEKTQEFCSEYLKKFLPSLLVRSLLWEAQALELRAESEQSGNNTDQQGNFNSADNLRGNLEEVILEETRPELFVKGTEECMENLLTELESTSVVDDTFEKNNCVQEQFQISSGSMDVEEGQCMDTLLEQLEKKCAGIADGDDGQPEFGCGSFQEPNILGSERKETQLQMKKAIEDQQWQTWMKEILEIQAEIDTARALCDWCATSLNIVGGQCDSCEKEFCPGCMKKNCQQMRCFSCKEGSLKLVRLLNKNYLQDVLNFLNTCKASDFCDLGDWGSEVESTNTSCSNSCNWIQQGRCRLSSNRPEGQNHILLQHTDDVQFGNQNRDSRLKEFQDRWSVGEPVVVTGITSKITWEPQALERAMRDLGNAAQGSERVTEVGVLDCNDWSGHLIKHSRFFNDYMKQEPDNLWKCKDWLPGDAFTEKLPAHLRCFLRQIPYPEYTHPEYGLLNITSEVNCAVGVPLPPDLGPKGYIAHGRIQQKEGMDSVTKLHLDLCDALNILEQSQFFEGEEHLQKKQPRSGQNVEMDQNDFGGAGAIWHIWRRQDGEKLQTFLRENVDEFQHAGEDIPYFSSENPIFSQEFYLNDRHLQMLQQQQGIQPWTFEQFVGEAIFVPAGCPHQVRNLRPCIKVAIDFVSPENGNVCIDLCEFLSRQNIPYAKKKLEAFDRSNEDKLQIRRLVSATAANLITQKLKLNPSKKKKRYQLE